MNISENFLVRLKEVTKSYENTDVINQLSFDLSKSDQVLLLGPNGAGKSTLLKIIAGLAKIDQGEVFYAKDFCQSGYLAQDLGLYAALSVQENLEFFTSFKNCQLDIKESLIEWGLKNYVNKRVAKLSRGLKQRLSLCKTFILKPKFLLLDEPTSHLDSAGISILQAFIAKTLCTAEAQGFLIASHDLQSFLGLAKNAALIAEGKISITATADLDRVVTQYHKVNR